MLSSTNQGRSHNQSPTAKSSAAIRSTVRGLTIAFTRYVVAAAALGLLALVGLVGWHYQRVQASVAWLDEVGASYQWHYTVPHLDRLTWQRVQSKLAPVVGQAAVSDIHTVTLDQPVLSDEALTELSRLVHLNKLTLGSDLATDETLERIAKLKQLRSLTLRGNRFTFEGLLELRKLPRLRYLTLSQMQLTMAELAVLESAVPLANLKYNQSDAHAPYERQVVARYPKAYAPEPTIEVGFEPLIQAGQTPVEGIPVRTLADDPETVHAS